MATAILKLLKAEWASLLVMAALLGGGVWFGTHLTAGKLSDQKASYETALRSQSDRFSDERAQWQVQKTAAANQYAADLKEALRQRDAEQVRADALTAQLAKLASDSERRVSDIKRRLNDALKRDGSSYTGLGPDGMQLWLDALGWSADGTLSAAAGHGVPETTGSAAAGAGHARTAGAGLTPGGIITGSAAYGQWCLSLRDRLQAINDFYATGAQP